MSAMKLTWDESKRLATFNERGLDFADAAFVFAGPTLPAQRSSTKTIAAITASAALSALACWQVVWRWLCAARRRAPHFFDEESE